MDTILHIGSVAGVYGMVAQECMALGKSVCVYLREDLEGYIPSHPMLNTTSDNIVNNLKQLIEDAALRANLGEKEEFMWRRCIIRPGSHKCFRISILDLFQYNIEMNAHPNVKSISIKHAL